MLFCFGGCGSNLKPGHCLCVPLTPQLRLLANSRLHLLQPPGAPTAHTAPTITPTAAQPPRTLTQMPHPMQRSSEIQEMVLVGTTSTHILPTLTTGQLFLHSCLHFLGLHLRRVGGVGHRGGAGGKVGDQGSAGRG